MPLGRVVVVLLATQRRVVLLADWLTGWRVMCFKVAAVASTMLCVKLQREHKDHNYVSCTKQTGKCATKEGSGTGEDE